MGSLHKVISMTMNIVIDPNLPHPRTARFKSGPALDAPLTATDRTWNGGATYGTVPPAFS